MAGTSEMDVRGFDDGEGTNGLGQSIPFGDVSGRGANLEV